MSNHIMNQYTINSTDQKTMKLCTVNYFKRDQLSTIYNPTNINSMIMAIILNKKIHHINGIKRI